MVNLVLVFTKSWVRHWPMVQCETTYHLLTSCVFTHEVWCRVLRHVHLGWLAPTMDDELLRHVQYILVICKFIITR